MPTHAMSDDPIQEIGLTLAPAPAQRGFLMRGASCR